MILNGSVSQTHLLSLLVQLILVLHLVLCTCIIFLCVLNILDILDVRVQIIDLDFNVDVNGRTCFVWCFVEILA